MIWLEIEPDPSRESVKLIGINDTIKEKICKSLKEVSEALKDNYNALIDGLSEISSNLREIEVEFAIKVDFEAKTPIYALAKASAGGTYTVKLKFNVNDSKE